MNMRPPMPPPPSGNPAGDADVVAYLQTTLIRPVDDMRAARDIEALAATAKARGNVTPLMSRRERTFKQVAAAAAVVVVASGAGFGAAQLGNAKQDVQDPDTLAFESIESDSQNPDVTTPQVADNPSSPDASDTDVSVDTAPSQTAPSPSQPAPAPVAPPAAPDPTVGDAGDAETIGEFVQDVPATDVDTCDDDVEATNTCDTDDTDQVVDDGTDPRDLLRERRFGAN